MQRARRSIRAADAAVRKVEVQSRDPDRLTRRLLQVRRGGAERAALPEAPRGLLVSTEPGAALEARDRYLLRPHEAVVLELAP